MSALRTSETAGPLIDAEALHAILGDPVIADVRHDLARPEAGRDAYRSGHLPGAHFLHLDEDLSGPKHSPEGAFRGRHPLPDRTALLRRLAGIGMRPDRLLVAYDDGAGIFAARLWWLARWLGYARVAVLDGGLDAWRRAGFELSTEVPEPRFVPVEAPGTAAMPTIDAEALLQALPTRRYRILDARAAERYRGDTEPLDAKAGHIPGALNRWHGLNLDAQGRFKSPTELRKEFEALLGNHPPEAVVHQCGSGVSACHNLLAMTVAGLPEGALYAGSWSEWSADPGRPIAIGPMP